MRRMVVALAVLGLLVGQAQAREITAQPAVMTADQANALAALPDVEAITLGDDGVPTFLAGRLGRLDGRDPAAAALRFVDRMAPALRATGAEGFAATRVRVDEMGMTHVRLQQYHNGLRVVGAELAIHSDPAGEVVALNGRFVPAHGLPSDPQLEAEAALESAAREAGITAGEVLDAPELVYVVTDGGKTYLTWVARVQHTDQVGLQIDRIFADAVTGGLAARHGLLKRALSRKVYNANYTDSMSALPGTLMFSEGGSSSDTVAMGAYNNAGTTYNYYKARFNRDSFNGSGGVMSSSVHFGKTDPNNVNNAFWNGSFTTYGDGDGSEFSSFAKALDVVAHEWTHAVTDYEADLTYSNESGALNEAMSDIFAAGIEAYKDGAITSDTWKIGEDCYTPATAGDALRYMNNPTADGISKDYYPERYTGTADYGGVHLNSGIGNLAFYLLVQGGTHPRSKTTVSVPAIGMAKAEQIFYRALANIMTSSTNFQGARNATAQAAADLYGGTSSAEYAAVQKAWDAVGVPGGVVSVTTLSNGVALSGQAASTGQWKYYKITVPSGQTSLVVESSGGSGDADLYVKLGGTPTTTSNNGKSEGSTSAEKVTISSPAAGDWYIGLYAYSSFSSVTIKATYSGSSGGTTMNETESNNTTSTANAISTSGTTVTGKIGSSTDVDYFRVSLPAGKTLAINLVVPSTKDYDVALYNSSGTKLASGTNGTGVAENVSWKNSGTTTVSVYIKVYGYNSAYSTTLSYSLKATW